MKMLITLFIVQVFISISARAQVDQKTVSTVLPIVYKLSNAEDRERLKKLEENCVEDHTPKPCVAISDVDLPRVEATKGIHLSDKPGESLACGTVTIVSHPHTIKEVKAAQNGSEDTKLINFDYKIIDPALMESSNISIRKGRLSVSEDNGKLLWRIEAGPGKKGTVQASAVIRL